VTRLSILIPCLRGAEQSEETLVSVLQNRPADCEVLVAHALPYDDPYDLADEVYFLHVPGRPNLIELVNAGLEATQGDVLHTLACGIQATEGWTEPALAHFADPKVGAVAALIMQGDQPTRIESLGVGYTLGGNRQVVGHNRPLPQRHKLGAHVRSPSLAAGFFVREVLDALGGFATEVGDGLADIDVALSLAELGYRTVAEPSCKLVTGSDFIGDQSSAGITRGRQLERLFLRHAASNGGIKALLAHPLAIAADAWSDLPHLGAVLKVLGRLVASWEFGTIQGYKQRMAEAAEYLAHEPTLEEARRLMESEPKSAANVPLPIRKAA
jgi:hypothetical protein